MALPEARSASARSLQVQDDEGDYRGPKAPWTPFVFVMIMYYSCQWTESGVALAFMRSRVRCDVPLPGANNTCPRGAVYSPPSNSSSAFEVLGDDFLLSASGAGEVDAFESGTCEPLPPGDVDWSMSPTCFDQTAVVARAKDVIGMITAAGQFGAAFSLIVAGNVLIDNWGRKPMMVVAFGAQFFNAMGFLAVIATRAYLENTVVQVLLTINAVAASCLNCFPAASGAMAVDGTVPNSPDRATRLAQWVIFRSAAGLVGAYSGVILIGLTLQDYTWVWICYGLLLGAETLATHFLLTETLPAIPTSASKAGLSGFATVRRELWVAFVMCTEDRQVFTAMLSVAVAGGVWVSAFSMMGNWVIVVLGMTASDAEMIPIVAAPAAIVGGLLVGPLCNLLTTLKTAYVGMSLQTLAFFVFPLGALLPRAGLVCANVGMGFGTVCLNVPFWFGIVLANVGMGLGIPPITAILTSRIAPENQGKLFSVTGIIQLPIAGTLTLVFAWVFVRSQEPEEMAREMAFAWNFAGAAFLGITFVFWCVFGCSAQDPEPRFISDSRTGSRLIDKED